LSWRRHNGCHFVSFVMYISGAKFNEHCFNISRDILDWVLNCFGGTTYDVITYNTKTWISLKRRKIFQKVKCHSSLPWKAFQISSNYFLLHRHFKACMKSHAIYEKYNCCYSSQTLISDKAFTVFWLVHWILVISQFPKLDLKWKVRCCLADFFFFFLFNQEAKVSLENWLKERLCWAFYQWNIRKDTAMPLTTEIVVIYSTMSVSTISAFTLEWMTRHFNKGYVGM